MRISRRNLLLAAGCRAWAQEPKFYAAVDVVTLLATVRDRDGLIVKNLNREDFLLERKWLPTDHPLLLPRIGPSSDNRAPARMCPEGPQRATSARVEFTGNVRTQEAA